MLKHPPLLSLTLSPHHNTPHHTTGGTKYPNRFEYLWLLTGICVVGMSVFLQALHYPRTIFELASDLFTKGRWPSYYKVAISGPEAGAKDKSSDNGGGGGDDDDDNDINIINNNNNNNNNNSDDTRRILGGRRVTADGKEEFLLESAGADGKAGNSGDARWASREALCVDGTGPAYAERGALYAGSSGGNSTRARIETYKSLVFAEERLGMDVAR